MAKTLTDKEMCDIIHRTIHDPEILGEQRTYCRFLEDLAQLICSYFGGTPGNLGLPDYDLPHYTVGFHVNECVPTDGGVFKDYDTDVTWKDGEET